MIDSINANRLKLPLTGLTPGRPLIIGHRGAASHFPENTIPAFQAAIRAGANAIELDVRITRDGALVVIHDKTVDRTTSGSGRISDLTLAQIKALDAGYRFSPDQGRTFPFRNRSVRVPTLAEVLSATEGTMIFLELKGSSRKLADAVIACLIEKKALDRVLIQTIGASHGLARYLRKKDRRLLVGHSCFEIGLFFALSVLHLERLFKPRGPSFEIPPRRFGLSFLSPFFVKRAQKAGVSVIVWTVDDQPTLSKCMDLAIDGVITNDPARTGKLKTTAFQL